ncbi:MAG: hypothetical protein HUU20_23765 [Pirellulales bacterium]|nr:hypothetical protein [Pirellulales bacterium]
MLRESYGEGAQIARVSRDGAVRVLTRTFQSACEPDVSFDGTRFLFAAKRSADDQWNIYEMTADGGRFCQITRSLGDCRSPCYQSTHFRLSESQPWYQITFVRTIARTLNESGSGPATALYSCKLDGSFVQRLTFNLSSDFDPAVMWDGRLLYSGWQRRNLDHGLRGRVAIMEANTDGTDYSPFVLGAGLQIKHMVCTTAADLAVFVETERAGWDGAGQLGSVSLLRPAHTYCPLTGPSEGLFHSPSPLPDGTILVSRRPADGSGTHAVYRLDPQSKKTALLYDDPQRHDIQAKVIAPRQEPDGRSSSISDDDPAGKLYCLNVYANDFPNRTWMPAGSAKRLRVVEGVPRTAGDSSVQPGRDLPPLAHRRIVGETPIADDGSFNIEVPANLPLELQLLDEHGLALRSCGWVWTRNHFNQGCVGCHEDRELTPENRLVWALDQRTVSLLTPPERREAVDFMNHVLPIVAAKCIGCHGKNGSPPVLGDSAEVEAKQIYLLLRSPADAGGPDSGLGKYVHPGRARTSPLVWHVLGRNSSRPWDGAWAAQPAKPIPPDQPVSLTDSERDTIARWIDLGAAFESGHAGRPSAHAGQSGTDGRQP